jgi:hypothetical protein
MEVKGVDPRQTGAPPRCPTWNASYEDWRAPSPPVDVAILAARTSLPVLKNLLIIFTVNFFPGKSQRLYQIIRPSLTPATQLV